MENQFNITKALQHAPKGLYLYSPLIGKVKLNSAGTLIHVSDDDGDEYSFDEYGCYIQGAGECLLFPSKEHRTWHNWQQVLLLQSVGSVCLSNCGYFPTKYICESNGTCFSDGTGRTWETLLDDGGSYLNVSRYAIPEETERFFDDLKVNGYEWNGKKVVRIKSKAEENTQTKAEQGKPTSEKFDISTLQPFDRVLVRDTNDQRWKCNFYSHYRKIGFHYKCISFEYNQCIPYNEDTKHLVGTTAAAPDYYKTWD